MLTIFNLNYVELLADAVTAIETLIYNNPGRPGRVYRYRFGILLIFQYLHQRLNSPIIITRDKLKQNSIKGPVHIYWEITAVAWKNHLSNP